MATDDERSGTTAVGAAAGCRSEVHAPAGRSACWRDGWHANTTRVGDDRDPAFIEQQVPRVRAVTSYFSPEVRGSSTCRPRDPPC